MSPSGRLVRIIALQYLHSKTVRDALHDFLVAVYKAREVLLSGMRYGIISVVAMIKSVRLHKSCR